MKKQLILMLLITLTFSFSSCGSKAPMEDTTGVIESTVISESEATETQSEAEATETQSEAESTESKSTELTESVYTPDPTSTPTPTSTSTPEPTVDESTMTAEEVLATVPTSVYDPSDTSLTLDEQKEKAKDALHDGTITERQYAVISKDIRERKEAASSSTTNSLGTTTTGGDTYIPAHGNPGTVMSNEDTGYDFADEPKIDASNVTIE